MVVVVSSLVTAAARASPHRPRRWRVSGRRSEPPRELPLTRLASARVLGAPPSLLLGGAARDGRPDPATEPSAATEAAQRHRNELLPHSPQLRRLVVYERASARSPTTSPNFAPSRRAGRAQPKTSAGDRLHRQLHGAVAGVRHPEAERGELVRLDARDGHVARPALRRWCRSRCAPRGRARRRRPARRCGARSSCPAARGCRRSASPARCRARGGCRRRSR